MILSEAFWSFSVIKRDPHMGLSKRSKSFSLVPPFRGFLFFLSLILFSQSNLGLANFSTPPSAQPSSVAFSPTCSGVDMLTDGTGTVSDGSGVGDYGNGLDCQWLIQPEGAVSVTLIFSGFDLEPCFDFVRLYDGSDTSAALLGEYEGNVLPSEITTSGGALLIRFTTDSSNTASGWSASYSSSYCTGTDTLTSLSDTISDGSGTFAYGPNAECLWLVSPARADSVALDFISFNLENGNDSVLVYDGATTSDSLLRAMTGSSLPGQIVSGGSELLIQFISNESVQSSGWSAVYTAFIPQVCPDSVWVAEAPMASDTFQASDYLESDGEVHADSVVVFLADHIRLLPGFHAMPGADFHALPIGCVEPLPRKDAQVSEMRPDEPEDIALPLTCYPNPFRDQATIEFKLKRATTVTLRVHDFSGNAVISIFSNERLDPGTYHEVIRKGQLVPGIYIIVLRTGNGQVKTRKLVLQ